MLRIWDVYPGSRFLPIPDPGSKNSNKREGWKKICYHTFFCIHKFHKIEYFFIFEMLKKKIWAIFKELLKFLPITFSLSSLKYGFGIRDWDPGSGKNLFWIPDPGSRGQKDTGSRIRIRNTDLNTYIILYTLENTNYSIFLLSAAPWC